MQKINKLISDYNHNDGDISRIKYIVIHYVGALGGAEANCRYYAGGNRGASAHYFVGFDGEIWQSVEDANIAWHCGASTGSYKHAECRNANSIGIEMCVRKHDASHLSSTDKDWYFEDATVQSAVDLTKYLMEKYNVPADHVIRHYDVTGKICPNPYVYNTTSHTWTEFKNLIRQDKEDDDIVDMTRLYRVRKTWDDAGSQIGAYSVLDNAKAACPEGYTVYDWDGNAVYGANFNQPTNGENHNMSNEEFIQFVGEIAQKDWSERHIMLPSVVIAQAIKESGWGSSELAQNANALFGIKKNGWIGKTYVKQAVEQNPDGTYYTVDNTEWRAYDSWERSIIDHNDYIATRSTDGGKTLRYEPIIGCTNYQQVCQGLQDCGYATSLTYADSLIESIQERNLTAYDPQEDDTAPDGYLWIVQAGAYRSLNNAIAFSEKLKGMGVENLIKQYKVD